MGHIYQIKNKVNNKIYIGSAVDVRIRWLTHKSHLIKNRSNCSKLQNAFNKYGRDINNFEFSIIEECRDEDLIQREQYYIDKLSACENGYNIRKIAHSNLGIKKPHSQETKDKISKANTGKKKSLEERIQMSIRHTGRKHKEDFKKRLSDERCGPGNPFWNKKHTDETKKKMSLQRRGKPLTDQQKQKMSISAKKAWEKRRRLNEVT